MTQPLLTVLICSVFALPLALGLRDVVYALTDATDALRRRRRDRLRRERLGLELPKEWR